jgi:hypothetical protein
MVLPFCGASTLFRCGFAQSVSGGPKQFPSVKRFTKETCGPLGESPLFYLIVVMSGDEDDRQFGTHAANMSLQGDTVHPRHADICDQAAGRCQVASTKEVFGAGKHARGEPGRCHEAFQRFPNPGIVIDNRYDWFY